MSKRPVLPILISSLILALASASMLSADGLLADPVVELDLLCDENGSQCHGVAVDFEFLSGVTGEFTLHFENATNLTSNSLEFTIEEIDPANPTLQSRLPVATFIPESFPVLIRVDPKSGDPFTFERHWTAELYTQDLDFTPFTSYRLLRSPNGGAFEGITVGLGSGSFRVHGAGADFSEFVVGADLRSSRRLLRVKLAALDNALTTLGGSITGGLLGTLETLVGDASSQVQAGDFATAATKINNFIDLVEANAGFLVPDVSNPGSGSISVAGRLLSRAETLHHCLRLAAYSTRSGTISAFRQRVPVTGGGGLTVVVGLEVEGAFEIEPDEITITAQLVDPNDPVLLARLPAGVTIPSTFPVLVHIDPNDASGQAFRGRILVELATDDLDFNPRFRLFKAPDGGAFEDVSTRLGLGSFRVHGAGADFSDFIIARDSRSPLQLINLKLARLDQILDDHTLPALAESTLADIFSRLDAAVSANDYAGAIGILAELAEFLIGDTEDIPALWRPDGSTINVAGELRALGECLKFQLDFLQMPIADPNDVNGDGQVDLSDVFQVIDSVFGQAGAAPAPLVIRHMKIHEPR